jgi:hypothetical protein
MSNKSDGVGRRVATEEEIAKVLGGFEEEMLADLYKRREEELRSRPKAKVLEFPPKLSEQEPLRRQQIIEQDRERLEAQINEQRLAAGLPSLETARQERKNLENAAEPVTKASGYDPVRKFQKETMSERCHRGPLDSDHDL